VLYLVRSIERSVRRYLPSELDRRRFDRAKQFVAAAESRDGSDEMARRMHARWLKFLCGRRPAQRQIWAKETEVLQQFATDFGLPDAERRTFVGMSLLGALWREWCFNELFRGPPERVARLTHVRGWEHFERCRQGGAGLILLPVHGQFSRLFQPYLRHRGYDGLEVGLTHDRLERKGMLTPVAKRLELARQMLAAKRLLTQGGIAYNLPDARQNLDNARSVEFFGRRRQLATGFAELALATGAHVVTVAYRFSPRGFFVIEFGAPLLVSGQQSTHEERVDSLVSQYADFLRGEWRRYLWNIHWDHLKHFYLLPRSSSETAESIGRAAQALPQ
jgi:KDO2-lipid IV(A) lauroyltransferase